MQQWYQCPGCGAQVAFGTSFCGNCGLQLNWPAQQQPQQTPQYQPPPQQPVQTSQYQQQYQQPEITSQQEKEVQLSPYEAKVMEALYREARNQAGGKDLMWGFILLVVGGLITLGTYAAAESGGSFWIMWGLMALGAFYILRGLYRKITSNTAQRSLAWVLASMLLVGVIVGGTMAITNTMTSSTLTPPSEDFVLAEDDTVWVDETSGTVRVSGIITNAHSEWPIKNVHVELETSDAEGSLLKTYDVSVVPSKLNPGEKGVYDKTLQVQSSCTWIQPFVRWEWEAP